MSKKDDLSRHLYNSLQITDAKIDLRSVVEASILKEEKLNCENPEKLSLKEINVVIHELKVHQIELEMQNEELRIIQLELDQAKARYFDIYDLAPEGYLIVSEKGLILEANLTAAMMLGLTRINLIKQQLSQYICKEDQDNYYLYNKKLFKTLKPEVCELRMKRDDGTTIWGYMKATVATEEGLPVCRIILSDVTDRKHAEAKITHLASFPRLNPDPTIELNQDGSINYANPAAKKLFPDLELVGISHPFLLNWQTAVAQFSAQENDPLVREIMVGDCIYSQSFRYIESSKTIRIYSQDITDRKRAENALMESENLFRTSFESATAGIVIVGKNVMFIKVNDRACELWGYTREELLLLKFNDITYEEDKVVGTNFVNKMISGELSSAVFEKRYVKKDGTVIWALVSISAIRNNHNEFQYFITYIQNITDSKEKEKYAAELLIANNELAYQNEEKEKRAAELLIANQELAYQNEEKEKRAAELLITNKELTIKNEEISYINKQIKHAAEEWRTTFDSITDFISIHDKDFRIVRVNKAFAKVINMKPQELIGKICYEVFHGTKEPCLTCPHMETLKIKKPVAVEYFEPYLGIHLEVATAPIFDMKGEVEFAVHIARDITKRKEMEERLIVADRLASIGELASGIAHELNNPLTGVIGLSQLLLARITDESIIEDLQLINSEALRAAAVVKNMLTFARKHPLEKQLLNINEVISKVLEIRSYMERVSNIEVVTHLASDLPQIMVDYFQLQQVFFNIVINAEQSIIEAHDKGSLTITTQSVGDMVRASFTDDGPGISIENLRHVFDPFFTTKEVGKGTGLGLSICHGIVTALGGRIFATSKPGKGATFIMELPLGREEKIQ